MARVTFRFRWARVGAHIQVRLFATSGALIGKLTFSDAEWATFRAIVPEGAIVAFLEEEP